MPSCTKHALKPLRPDCLNIVAKPLFTTTTRQTLNDRATAAKATKEAAKGFLAPQHALCQHAKL
jgi:hypothetical protein